MNTKTRERIDLAAAKRAVKSWSNQEFEEMRMHLGLSRSREELLGVCSDPKTKPRSVAKKK